MGGHSRFFCRESIYDEFQHSRFVPELIFVEFRHSLFVQKLDVFRLLAFTFLQELEVWGIPAKYLNAGIQHGFDFQDLTVTRDSKTKIYDSYKLCLKIIFISNTVHAR